MSTRVKEAFISFKLLSISSFMFLLFVTKSGSDIFPEIEFKFSENCARSSLIELLRFLSVIILFNEAIGFCSASKSLFASSAFWENLSLIPARSFWCSVACSAIWFRTSEAWANPALAFSKFSGVTYFITTWETVFKPSTISSDAWSQLSEVIGS